MLRNITSAGLETSAVKHRLRLNGILHRTKIASFFMLLLAPFYLHAGQTTVIFQPGSITGGPFPSNMLTNPDLFTRTHLRVAIPYSEAQFCTSDHAQGICSNVNLLNQLDGFSVNPRVMVCFSDEVDRQTLKDGIKLVAVDDPGTVLSLNQFLYHSASNVKSYCAYAKPDNVLNQQSRYLLLVTDAVKDSSGHKVKDDGSFKSALKSGDPYYLSLASALDSLPKNLPLSGKIVSASLFTTMSATSWLQDAYSYVNLLPPGIIMPAPNNYKFKVSELSSFTWQIDTGTSIVPSPIPLSALSPSDTPANSKVGYIEFGLFSSPNYLNADGTITTNTIKLPAVASFLNAMPSGSMQISFHVFLPADPMPFGGWPVVIYGHGLGDSQFGAPTYIASTMAANGYATLALEITGHGGGPGSTVALTDTTGTHTVITPGRSAQTCAVPGPIAVRDCSLQTAVDLFALVKSIQQTDKSVFGLNPQQIYYIGQSFGSAYGTLFHAVEPSVKAAVLSVGGGSNVDVARLTVPGRELAGGYLAMQNLLNVPPASPPEYFHDQFQGSHPFNDEYVYRDEPQTRLDSVAGALAAQSAFESADWIGMLGDPLAYAPHLKNAPLSGVPVKSTFFQYSLGDLEEPNPANSALIRAAGIQSSSWLFRFDWAVSKDPGLLGIMSPDFPLPILPHRILSNPTIFAHPGETSIALAEQRSVADYFKSGGQTIPNPNNYLTGEFAGITLFEQPAQLPERLNFLQIPK